MSNFLYGMHERCPIEVMPGGWILYIAEVGDGNDPHPGIDLSDEPRARMIRIQWLFGDHGGCYPPLDRLSGFIQRVESLAANTPDCHVWIAGNEPNLSIEGLFTPEYAADMYKSIRIAIRMLAGHENDIVLLPPIGPWNVEIGYGWIEYFVRVIDLCLGIDGFAVHTYSRGPNPASITSEDKMDAPYGHLYNGFRTYRDWLAAIPARHQDRPVYITETNQNDAWLDENNGWVQAAYKEVDDWNQAAIVEHKQLIQCLMLYRWPNFDKYGIEGLGGVIDGIRDAISHGYTVPEKGEPPVAEWKTIYLNDMEQGFHDQADPETGQPATELTVPAGTKVHWIQGPGEGDYPRPEMDEKTWPQPEVHEGLRSCTGFYISAEGRFGYVTDRIYVTPGDPLRWSAMYMHVFNGQHAAGGSRVGICLGDGPFDVGPATAWPKDGPNPFEHEAIQWGGWRGTYQGDSYLPDREWAKLTTPEIQHGVNFVRGVVLFHADQRGEGSHGHWDLFRLEAYTETDPPDKPPPGGGECDLSELYDLKAQEAEILSGAYGAISELYRSEA